MATLIPANGSPTTPVTLEANDALSLEQMHGLVGGDIEVLYFDTSGPVWSVLVIDEDGKRANRPINVRATQLFAGRLQPGDAIVGDAVLCEVRHAGTDREEWS